MRDRHKDTEIVISIFFFNFDILFFQKYIIISILEFYYEWKVVSETLQYYFFNKKKMLKNPRYNLILRELQN